MPPRRTRKRNRTPARRHAQPRRRKAAAGSFESIDFIHTSKVVSVDFIADNRVDFVPDGVEAQGAIDARYADDIKAASDFEQKIEAKATKVMAELQAALYRLGM